MFRGGALAAGTALALSAGGLVTATPSGAERRPAAKMMEKVTFQLGWLKLAQFGGHFVALQKGYFKEEGIDAVFLSGGDNIDGLTLVESGQVDMADANGSDILTAVSKSIPIKCFGTIYQSTPNALMALKKNNLTTLRSLKGKTVGLPNGEQQLLQAMFKQAGSTRATSSSLSSGPTHRFSPRARSTPTSGTGPSRASICNKPVMT
jgi:ABC-type nitrate/sulfonate/bicarbonate transport system substrate-binding protein